MFMLLLKRWPDDSHLLPGTLLKRALGTDAHALPAAMIKMKYCVTVLPDICSCHSSKAEFQSETQ